MRLIALFFFCTSAFAQTTFQSKPPTTPWFPTDISSMVLRVRGADSTSANKILRTIAIPNWQTSLTFSIQTLVPSTTAWTVKSLGVYITPATATNIGPFELPTLAFPVPHQAPAGQYLQIDYNAATGLVTLGPVGGTPPPPPPPPSSITSSIPNGATISGAILWTVTISGTTPSFVNFYIDGGLQWTEGLAPYQFNGDPNGRLQTGTMANGAHVLRVIATFPDNTTQSLDINVNVLN